MIKKLLFFLVPAAIAALAIFLTYYWWNQVVKPVSNNTSSYDFLITKGSPASQIANKLREQGLISDSLAFRIYVQITGKSKKILAGEYSLSPSYSLLKIVDILGRGPIELWITIPEGLRREEIAERFANSLGKKDKTAFIQEFLTSSKAKEGYLFPDTYLFPKTASASAVVAKMLGTFDKKIDSGIREQIVSRGYDLPEVTTLASIIERETKTQEERPIVAGILYNRLKAAWPLQADATLQYAVASVKCQGSDAKCNWWEALSKEDLEIKSGYNTYKFSGLPPTPICNPGLSSIKAAANPQDTDFWFYLHDVNGQIHYAQTISQHNENVRKYLAK